MPLSVASSGLGAPRHGRRTELTERWDRSKREVRTIDRPYVPNGVTRPRCGRHQTRLLIWKAGSRTALAKPVAFPALPPSVAPVLAADIARLRAGKCTFRGRHRGPWRRAIEAVDLVLAVHVIALLADPPLARPITDGAVWRVIRTTAFAAERIARRYAEDSSNHFIVRGVFAAQTGRVRSRPRVWPEKWRA